MIIVTEKNNVETKCVRCGKPIKYTQIYDFDGSDGFCFPCYIGSTGKRTILDHSYKPEPVFCHTDIERETKENKLLYLGIELEVEHRTINLIDYAYKLQTENGLYVKHDGSLNRGIEIVSHPQTARYHQKVFNWYKLLEGLRKDRFTSYDNGHCGLHIHTNKSFFNSKDDQLKLTLFFYKCFDRVRRFSKRKDMEFCKKWEASLINQVSAVKGQVELVKPNHDRYLCINFDPVNTAEFRIYKGTLNYDRFLCSILFTDAVCYFVKCYSLAFFHNPKNKINVLWNEFLKFVKSHDRYIALWRYLVRNDLDNNKEAPTTGLPPKEDYTGNKKEENKDIQFVPLDLVGINMSTGLSDLILPGIEYEGEKTEISTIDAGDGGNYYILFKQKTSGSSVVEYIIPKFASKIILKKSNMRIDKMIKVIRFMYDNAVNNYVINICDSNSSRAESYRTTISSMLEFYVFMGGEPSCFLETDINEMMKNFIGSCTFYYEIIRSDFVNVYNSM